MASQTDKKEEFRKYLEKSNVLATLTNILTDLFEMDVKPEDPGQYLYQKFGESLKKTSSPPSQPNHDGRETTQRDAAMTDVAPTTSAEVGNATAKPNQGSAPSTVGTSKPDAIQSASATVPAGTEAVNTQTNQSAQTQPPAEPSAAASAETPASTAKETTIVANEANSIGGSAEPNLSASQAQPSDTAMPLAGSLGPNGGVHVTNNATGPSPAPPAPVQ